MRLIKLLAKNYYECNGSFEGIYNKIGSLLTENNMTEESLYSYLDLNYPGSKLTNVEMFNTRKHHIINRTKELPEVLVKKPIVILEEQYDTLAQDKYKVYIELLTEYFRTSKYMETENGDFREYLNHLSGQSLKDINAIFNNKEFLLTVQSLMPKYKFIKDCTPAIQLGVFYVSSNLSDNAKNFILQRTIKNVVLNSIIIGEASAIYIRTNVIKQITEYSDETYTMVQDLSLACNRTIKETLELCNIRTVDYINQYLKHNCMYYMSNGKVIVHVPNGTDCVDLCLTQLQFKTLYEKDYLGFLAVEGTEKDRQVVIKRDRIIKLSEVF